MNGIYLLVIAPGVTSEDEAFNYRPFNRENLGSIIESASKRARSLAAKKGLTLTIESFAPYTGFFLGMDVSQLVGKVCIELEHMTPRALINCDYIHFKDESIGASVALGYFFQGHKKYAYITSDQCENNISCIPLRVGYDNDLEAFLFRDQLDAGFGKVLSQYPGGDK